MLCICNLKREYRDCIKAEETRLGSQGISAIIQYIKYIEGNVCSKDHTQEPPI